MSNKLTPRMIEIIETWRLGFVATVTVGGHPNISPNGTFVVLDDRTIAFGEIRAPHTVTNLVTQPEVAVSFINPLNRKGVRVHGQAALIRRGTDDFEALIPMFAEEWGALADKIYLIVKIPVLEAELLTSPAYDMGASEAELVAIYKQKMQDYQDD
jgi:predicted pyridoxine 5'-phosphate oxidase superfamily flavin-nucleotide-binding protein